MEHPPSTEKTGPQKGDVIEGTLEIDGIIAEGRTSTVASALDRETGKRLAVKIGRGSDLEATERFRRAARGMQKLTSPHAVKVLRVGTTAEGAPCMCMEHLEGRTLAQKIAQSGPLPIDEAVKWMLQACDALADAHANGLLHRDVDAENIFLAMPRSSAGGEPSVRVLDFGLAPVWRLGKGDGRLRPGDVPGTSFALAPELARGNDLDERVDVWGVGACLFRLLTNKPPFLARNLAELCTRVLAERAPDLGKVRPDVTPGLAAVVKRCLEREPADRFASIREVMIALTEALDEGPLTPQVKTEKATLDQLRAYADHPDDRITDPGPMTPHTVRVAPAFEAIATALEPPSNTSAEPAASIPRAPEPVIEDGPSTQPLGRLSPFAELPKAAPPSADPPSSEQERTIKPVFIGDGPVAQPLPKPSPAVMAMETVPPPPKALVPTEPARVRTFPLEPSAPTPLPRPSPAMMAAETIPRGMDPPPPPLVFQPVPPPNERPKSKLIVPLIFALGVAVSIVIGLYVARLATAPKPTVASTGEPASAAPTAAVTPAMPTAEPETTPATPPKLDEPEPPATASHRRPKRPLPVPAPSASAADPAPKGGNLYDPSAYDPK